MLRCWIREWYIGHRRPSIARRAEHLKAHQLGAGRERRVEDAAAREPAGEVHHHRSCAVGRRNDGEPKVGRLAGKQAVNKTRAFGPARGQKTSSLLGDECLSKEGSNVDSAGRLAPGRIAICGLRTGGARRHARPVARGSAVRIGT